MAKRVMLSDEAYKVLKAMKKEGESFSDVILRRLGKGNPAAILAYFKEREPNPELADAVEEASRELRKNLKLSRVDFS
ncbi:MAG TPA: antitoxin VapB family protein [Nitrososphaera sp.]|nr:antitoxin VapB family protein [Nitrososphaera sp.]